MGKAGGKARVWEGIMVSVQKRVALSLPLFFDATEVIGVVFKCFFS